MSTRVPLEVLGFRRAFTLLILLVVLPSAALSGFGVVAIINERAAVEKRLEVAWTSRLDALIERLAEALESAKAEETREGLVVVGPANDQLSVSGFWAGTDGLRTADPELREALARSLPQLSNIGGLNAVFSVSGPQTVLLVMARRSDKEIVGARLS